jgi:hypothetical protein
MSLTRFNIPSQKTLILPSLNFIERWASDGSLSALELKNLAATAGCFLYHFVDFNSQAKTQGEVEVELSRMGSEFQVTITNVGLPLFEAEMPELSTPEKIATMREQRGLKRLEYRNRGREGQQVVLALESSKAPVVTNVDALAPTGAEAKIRLLAPGEEASLSRLFYKVYRYRYINEYVYYPEKLAEMIQEGRLVSIVAEMDDGSLGGHVGLLRWSQDPDVYEAALGVVDPVNKHNGVFGRIFHRVQEIKNSLPYQYCIYDFVTNHPFTQRHIARYGYHDLALCLGSQVSETQARLSELGIGADAADMDRYSLLVAVASGVSKPFGSEICLPVQIGEATEFLLKPLNLRWVPAPRFYPLSRGGEFVLNLQPEQKAAFFDLVSPGLGVVNPILERVKSLLADGYQYVAVDAPLDSPGLGQLYDLLAMHGFFMSGYVPYCYSSRLAFRFQFLAPTKVSFDNIKLFSNNAQKLLALVRSDYERNRLL